MSFIDFSRSVITRRYSLADFGTPCGVVYTFPKILKGRLGRPETSEILRAELEPRSWPLHSSFRALSMTSSCQQKRKYFSKG